jgi:hypothetical protein
MSCKRQSKWGLCVQWQNIDTKSLYLSSGRILTMLYNYNFDHLGIWPEHFPFYATFVQ